MRKTYVAGFLFNDEGTRVMLVEKQRPAWQCGLFNGIGGHIEDGETPEEAMRREFREEAGVDITSWKRYATLKGVSEVEWRVHFFFAFDSVAYGQCKSLTDERILPFDSRGLPTRVIPNLHWLIPMALSMGKENASEFWIQEAYSKVATT